MTNTSCIQISFANARAMQLRSSAFNCPGGGCYMIYFSTSQHHPFQESCKSDPARRTLLQSACCFWHLRLTSAVICTGGGRSTVDRERLLSLEGHRSKLPRGRWADLTNLSLKRQQKSDPKTCKHKVSLAVSTCCSQSIKLELWFSLVYVPLVFK